MADLRESGSIEQDADVVMLMSRYYDKEKKEEDRNRIILNVAKQRNGPVGEVQLVWLPQLDVYKRQAKSGTTDFNGGFIVGE